MGDDESDRNELIRSPLNYMGTKIHSCCEIYPYLPQSPKFIDVCSGSGQVLLGRHKSKLEVLNDRNAGIVAFFKCVQDPNKLTQLMDLIRMMPYSREMFFDCKENWQKEQDDVVRGAKWYYLIQCSFAGKGQYFGRVKKGYSNIWDKIQGNLELFPYIHDRLAGVLIENMDWRKILSDFDDQDAVFYFDPPYFESNVYFHNFTKNDHIEMCHRIMQTEGFVALSGYKNPIYDAFTWDEVIPITVKELNVQDAHNHFSDLRMADKRQEMLYIKEFSA